MDCEICGGKSGVVDTVNDSDCIYRKRKCRECGHYFYTEEVDGTKEAYNAAVLKRKENKNKAE